MKKKYFILILIVIITFTASYFLKSDKATEVAVMKSYIGSITKTIEVSGIINSNDIETIQLNPGAEVVKVYVSENEQVQANQLLAELDNSELVISLEKAMINLEDLKAKLNDIKMNNSDVFILDNSLARKKEEYNKISDELNIAKEDLEKAKILYDENAISKAEYDKYVEIANSLNSKLKAAKLNLDDAIVNYNDLEKQKINNQLAIERQIKLVELDIKSINKKIEETKIYSSINGIVTELPLQEARKILNGETIRIYGTDFYELIAYVSQEDAIFIKENQKSIVTIDGLNTSYEGTVAFVSKTASTDNTNSLLPKIEIKIKINNHDNNVVSGYEAEAMIIIDSKDKQLVVKKESIKKEDDKEFVYILKDNIAKKIFIETGMSDDYLVNILDGIKENEIVIINPPVDLIDGDEVKATE